MSPRNPLHPFVARQNLRGAKAIIADEAPDNCERHSQLPCPPLHITQNMPVRSIASCFVVCSNLLNLWNHTELWTLRAIDIFAYKWVVVWGMWRRKRHYQHGIGTGNVLGCLLKLVRKLKTSGRSHAASLHIHGVGRLQRSGKGVDSPSQRLLSLAELLIT